MSVPSQCRIPAKTEYQPAMNLRFDHRQSLLSLSSSAVLLTLAIASAACPHLVAADDGDLFSEISMSQVIADKTSAQQPRPARGETVLGNQTLTDLLVAAGLEATSSNRRVQLPLTIRGDNGANGAKRSLRFSVDAEAERIELETTIEQVQSADALPSNRLIAWMTLAGANPQTSIVFSETESAVLLKHWIGNQSVTTNDLQNAVSKVREVARQAISTPDQRLITKQSDDEKPRVNPTRVDLARPTTNKTASATVSPAKRTETALPSSLLGTWSAKRSDQEAFAIRFESANRFKLVHFNNGKSTVSQGTAQLVGGKLVLAGDDGTRISGLFAATRSAANLAGAASGSPSNRKAFDWSLTDAAGNVAMKLTFVAQ